MTTLAYANPDLPAPRRRVWGLIACAIAVAAAFFITSKSLALAESLTAYTDCGTGRTRMGQMLIFGMPMCLSVPLGAWLTARWAHFGLLLCRCSLWASIAGWLTSALFVILK
jgi:hypothetical protein